MKQILIVEDDSFLNKMLSYNLTADGYGVTSALNFRTAAEAVRQREVGRTRGGAPRAKKYSRLPVWQSRYDWVHCSRCRRAPKSWYVTVVAGGRFPGRCADAWPRHNPL